MFIFLTLLCLLLFAGLCVSIFFLLRFARIIMIIEDDLGEAIQGHDSCLKTFDKILTMQLFFESPDVRPVLDEALAEIKACKMITMNIVQKFVERSKQKYIKIEEDEEKDIVED